MVTLVKLLGVVIVVMAAIFMARPEIMKKYMEFWTKEKRIYAGAAISLVLGMLLLRAASQCSVSWIVVIIGLWALVKGILLFIIGPERLKVQTNAILKMSVANKRLLLAISLAMGILMIYSA